MTALGSFEETRDIPIIIITGLGSTEDETKGLSFNAADYISKPFHTEIIKLRVRNQIKIVNQMREIRRLSTIDQLTHIPNRRGFDFQLAREWGRSIREKLPISILMLDVDKFKVYNDAFGHQQGDVVLQEVAKTITNSFGRTTDYGARWGGEEFVVLLPNTALEGAKEVAERIRTRIEDLSIPLANGDATGVTISIGVNSMVPEQGDELSEFIEIADKALYTAKKTGRNRVCHN
jgi:diguanylate cyclase (GGDEF)-like protein